MEAINVTIKPEYEETPLKKRKSNLPVKNNKARKNTKENIIKYIDFLNTGPENAKQKKEIIENIIKWGWVSIELAPKETYGNKARIKKVCADLSVKNESIFSLFILKKRLKIKDFSIRVKAKI